MEGLEIYGWDIVKHAEEPPKMSLERDVMGLSRFVVTIVAKDRSPDAIKGLVEMIKEETPKLKQGTRRVCGKVIY